MGEATQSFAENKNRIVTKFLTAYVSLSAQLTLSTNASSTTIGAALEQLHDNQWRHIGFFSRKLSQAERNYSTIESYLLFLLRFCYVCCY